ncbi:kinesin-like protein KIF13A [Saccoglossus kowalevskii]
MQENQQHLEKMGISVQTSGIKVEKDKCFLVNLNADPSLNELLVYYLKEHTLVGRPSAPSNPDIQLSGLGILSEHCIIDIENDYEVFVTPKEGARTCVNGSQISSRTSLKHGDRVLWGNNHFFRINCPRPPGVGSSGGNTPESEVPVDYDFAQSEVMMKELGNDPIQNAMKTLETHHKEDKDKALERQKDMYERQLEMLRNKLTPTQKQQLERFDIAQLSPQSTDSNAINMQTKYIQWEEERDEIFRQSLSKLREEVVKANALVREANFLAEEMGKKTEFHVTLQIPASNLTPNRKRGAIVSEPAIQVRRKSKGTQVWSMEKMINKIIDMRDMYEERKERGLPLKDTGVPISGDPFYESQENHNLIGVANIFLEVLFHDVRIEYAVPIINQQGEVSGRLHVELQRISGPSLDWTPDSDCSTDSGGFEVLGEVEPEGLSIGSQLTCRLKISHASGLPPSLANFVFCQYTFWGEEDYCVVPPVVKQVTTRRKIPEYSMKFDHVREYTVNVTEEFIEHALEGSLAVEVWGHRSAGFDAKPSGWEVDSLHAKSRSLADRWGELTRKIELWLEVLELNEQGEYFPVELQPRPEVLTGGVFQLRQGHSRRVCVKVKPVQDSGTLPLVCEAITGISVGSICGRSKLQKGLDSYQDEDLTRLREKWSEALMRRREYLDEQIHKIINKSEKNDTDVEREASLINQWVSLTEERNAVLVPAANSGIPGAPAEWNPPLGMETHIPVLFLDLNADEMGSTCLLDGAQPAGTNSILPKEHGTKFYNLPIVKYCDKDVSAVASWDSSIHDSLNLNRVTGTNERVYLIVKVVARLSHPAAMEMVLRKRICVNIYKKQSFSFTFRKKFYRMPESCHSCGVTYEVVSNIPKASEDPEDRESLALMAASGADEGGTADGETYIEKYTKGVSAVESILALDRLRQEVVIKEKLAAQGRPLRKTASVPNIQGALSRSMDARFDIIDEDFRMPRSESLYSYLNSSQQSATLPSYTLHNPQPNPELFSFFRGRSKSEAYDGQLMYGSAGSLIHPGSPGMAMYTSSPKSISPSPSKYSHHYLGPVKEEKSKESMVENSNLNLYDDDDSCSLSPKAIAIPRTSPSHSRESPSRSLDSPIQSLELEKESSLQKTFTMSLENDNISNSSCQSNVQSIVMSSNTDVDSFGNQDTETHRPLSMVSSGYSSNLTLTEDTLSIHSYDEGPDHKVNSNKSTEEEIKSPFSDEEDGNTSTLTEERLQKVLNEDANEKINDDDKKDVSVETSLKTNSEGHSACKKVQVSDLLHRAEKYNSENLDMKEDEPIEITTSVAMVMNKNNVTECIEKKMSDISNDVDKLGEKKNALVTMAMDTYAEEHCDVVLATSDSTSVSIETNSVSLEISELKADDDNFADISGLEPLLIIEDENENNSTSHLLEKEKSITTKINDLQEIKVEQQSLEIIESFKLDQTVVTPTNEFELHISEDEKLILTENDAESRLSSVSGMHALEDDMSDDSLSMCSFDSRQDGDRRHDIPLPAWLKISQHVSIGTSRTGVVKFIGNTTFKSGTWVGVKLDTPTGKNNGQVDGVHYFRCPPKHGIFVRPDKLKQINKPTPSKTKMIPARPSPQSSKVSSPNASPIRHHMMSGSGGSSPHSSPVGSPCVTRNMKTIRK